MRPGAVLLRPGVAIGYYPQKSDVRDSWLDRGASTISGYFRQLTHRRKSVHSRFVDQVNAFAPELEALTDDQMQKRVGLIGMRLYSQGLEDFTVAESFALIRELASRHLGMRHHDVQVLGGHVMLKGMIAEMETGEGKTLTAVLPACTAALAGIPVHIVTVNDFLVTRDADWMRPLYQAMGLTVGAITEEMNSEQRRKAYHCSITYCTNKQLVFDYLKDSLLLGQENRRLHMQLEGLYRDKPRSSRLLMRGLCFAIVDEADSVLVDEARTPLIISNKGDAEQQARDYQLAIDIARNLEIKRDFTLRAREKQAALTDFGRARIATKSQGMDGLWGSASRRNEMVAQALSAVYLYQPDIHYLVKDSKIMIIDEYTGRVMPDRSWERGLHQMIETKEGCALSGRQETLARISYQKFFRRYLRLSGMTGTAREISAELWSVYRLNVVSIPTHRPLRRKQLADRAFARSEDKWKDVVATVREMHGQGRPVLIGTRSVADSELLDAVLDREGISHVVLNARQDEEEAFIISQAGQSGRVTVATNMAGRGTDIRLQAGLEEIGGLHVIATCRHDARRIDRQLYGRSGRQGDTGSFQSVISLEDELITNLLGERLVSAIQARWKTAEPLPAWLGRLIAGLAQHSAERHHGQVRRQLLKLDENLGDMLAFSGRNE